MTIDLKQHADCLAYAIGSPHPIARGDCERSRAALIAECELLQSQVRALEDMYRRKFDACESAITENARLREALKNTLWLAEKWADGVGRSHPDHEICSEARAALAPTPAEPFTRVKVDEYAVKEKP